MTSCNLGFCFFDSLLNIHREGRTNNTEYDSTIADGIQNPLWPSDIKGVQDLF